MRPRVFPAEDGRRSARDAGARSRFNEAAGIPRGRRTPDGSFPLDLFASMRPRVFPAEDMCVVVPTSRHPTLQ